MTNGTLGKIAVMGAGAVGCYYGGMLARAGHNVTLIGRQRHVVAVKARGLTLEMRGSSEQIAMEASVEPAAVAGARVRMRVIAVSNIIKRFV